MDGIGVEREDGSLFFEEFEEGDARREISLADMIEARALMKARDRWHRRDRSVDWFAVQLQFGRGFANTDIARQFGIGDSRISSRARDEKWVQPMSERDLQRLSRFVWLAGLWRGAGEEPESRARLKAASEWCFPEEVTLPKFKPLDRQGAPVAATFNQEIPDDIYYSAADPKREDRISMRRQIDELIAEAERAIAGKQAHRDGEVRQPLAGAACGADEPAIAGEGLDLVGPSQPVAS